MGEQHRGRFDDVADSDFGDRAFSCAERYEFCAGTRAHGGLWFQYRGYVDACRHCAECDFVGFHAGKLWGHDQFPWVDASGSSACLDFARACLVGSHEVGISH